MSVALICPHCQVATTFHRVPISACPNCQSAFPPALKDPAEATLARQEAPQPIGISILRFVAVGWGCWWLFRTLLVLSGVGRYQINGELVSTTEFFERAGIEWGLGGAASLSAGIGIWLERSWSRHLILAFWLVVFALYMGLAMTVGGFAVVKNAVYGVIVIGIAVWYLYDKENVVRYYRALEMRGRVGLTRAPDDV